ncbi:hypothetical protein LXL04_018825 [Taraxacum kok-saghyz]
MASAACQGDLQSCLEPPLTHKSSVMDDNGDQKVSKNNNGFSFFNVLENPSSVKNEEVYVHPMVKRSASSLSSMSLEMCTESLGTETGSDVSDSSDEFSWEERERFRRLQRSKARNFHRKVASHRGGVGFPPPLTSISGLNGTVKVSPHREGGRLVIKAVSISDCGTKFETERTDGRLRLSLLKDCCGNVESERANVKNEGGEENCCDGHVVEGGCGWWWKVEGHNLKRQTHAFEDSTDIRLSSCKDANKGIGNWSLFRVVIS